VGIVEIVVAQLLALNLLGRGETAYRVGAQLGHRIEGRRLMRILAVAQTLPAGAADRPVTREGLADLPGEPAGYGGVIGGGPGVGGCREAPAQRRARGAAIRLHLVCERRRILGVGNDRDDLVILRRRTDQRRAADVDVLDAGR